MEDMKKYKFTGEEMNYNGHILHRIEAVRDFGDVKAGDIGGWIEEEANLSHDDTCWVYDEAKVYGYAVVYGDAVISSYARAFGHAKISGDVKVCDDVVICGVADLRGDAVISSISDYIVFKNWWSSGRYFTWTRSNDMWSVGCFYGTGEELIAKAYKDSEISGREYERIVKYVDKIKDLIEDKKC